MRRLLLAALVVVPLGQIQAQRPAPIYKNWVTFGMGRATWGGLTELGGQFTFSHQAGRVVMTGRALIGFDLLGGVLASDGAVIDVQDFGLMLGVGNRPGLFRYSIGTGVALAVITHQGPMTVDHADDPQTSAVGLPLEAQFFVQPLRFLGVGVYGHGDLNKERSFWGWSISVALGRLR